MRELSNREVGLVSGGLGPLAFMGFTGLASAGTYTVQSLINGSGISVGGFAGAFVTGAVGGGYGLLGKGLTGAAAAANIVHSGAVGALYGSATAGMINRGGSIRSGSGGGGGGGGGGSR